MRKNLPMESVQDTRDDRNISLDRVGVRDLVYPVALPQRDGGSRTTVAKIGLYVALPSDARGTHMSRFVETFEQHRDGLSPDSLRALLGKLKRDLGAESAHMEAEFTCFIEKTAPLSGSTSLMACPAGFEASLSDSFDFTMMVTVPVMTVCPCSKEATGGAAHSQRGHVSVAVRYNGRMWIDELVDLVEACASSPVYPLLKNEDERSIIERAHRRPAFVEDVARGVAERLNSDVRVFWYRVEAQNMDSIHDHNLYASVERRR